MDFKKYFSIFENYKNENGKDLIYLDSASSSLTPDSVIEKMNDYYTKYRSNVDRAISKISDKANNEYINARKILAEFLNCSEDEIIWTSGATASSNLLINLIDKHNDEFHFLNEGDEILTTIMEHHSSLVPLQEFTKKQKMKLKFLELDKNFNLDFSNMSELVNQKTKIVSITLASNVLGTINNLKEIISKIKKINKDIFVICDATAAFGHVDINMNELQNYVDAAYFSLHKAFGPTGVGVLWVKREILREMKPAIFGGGMISHVEKEISEYRSDIKVFEPGTPNISGVIGAGEAIKFIKEVSEGDINKNILSHTQDLVKILIEKLKELNENNKENFKIKIFAADSEKNAGTVSFQIFIDGKEIHPHDVAEILARNEVSVRAGHHCAEPLMNYLGVPNGLTRVSFHIYNNEKDIDILISSILEVKKVFGK